MLNRFDYEFEYYEKYYGDREQVKRTMEDCPQCCSKMVTTYFCDNGNLLVQEATRCNNCDFGQRKVIHSLN